MKMCLVKFPSGNIYIAEKRGNAITLISQFAIIYPVGSISDFPRLIPDTLRIAIIAESEVEP